ncbi:H-NS histone family protein [Acidovorax sp. LjRoot66]|jgi:DNA-binding protein H-NS|uniref:H-NS histone family protein n=1 Tax=Acidovorax sp. LjRoot66 TaxID=3342334 RepID=UPI003ECFAB32
MSSYKTLLAQRERLDQQILEAKKREQGDAVSQVRSLIAEFGLTSEDVFPVRRRTTAGSSVAPKYKDPATGATWTGRGKPPLWIKDKDRSQFAMAD